jgi:peptidoglycan LD-endopeptidase CwlK
MKKTFQKYHLFAVLLIIVFLFSCKVKTEDNATDTNEDSLNFDVLDAELKEEAFAEEMEEKITDSEEQGRTDKLLTFEEAIKGTEAPQYIIDNMELIELNYFGYDSIIHTGQMVVNKDLSAEIIAVFDHLLEQKFPINKIQPVVKYNWSDDSSMADNNTSCFNYRIVEATQQISHHSYGCAIDINPKQNPYILHGKAKPEGSVYNEDSVGTISRGSVVVKTFRKYGWYWGGHWKTNKDYQHFYKPIVIKENGKTLFPEDTVYTIQKGEVWKVLEQKFGVCRYHIIENNHDSLFFEGKSKNLYPLRGNTISIPLRFSKLKKYNPYQYKQFAGLSCK